MILGIDEVGRGPWAGPLVVGAVVLGDAKIDGLTDSKKLSKKRREVLDEKIKSQAAAWALGWVHADELDHIGMSASLRLATRRAVEQIHVPYHEIIIDGTINFLQDTSKGEYVTCLAKADLLIPSVSAASIIAKVARDYYMAEQHEKYPEYGFAGNAGYGVALHRAAIEGYGVTPLHRLSFAPLKKYSNHEDKVREANSLTTRQIGNDSESAACRYLESNGHTILERNWKTRWCEIDIISTKDEVLYFTEVKHRKNSDSGSGIEAITPRKKQQMTFSAELFAARKSIHDMRLAVIATTGEHPEVIDYLEII